MIIDKVTAIDRYAGLGKNYALAAEFLLHADLKALPLGKIEIDGENVFANLADNWLDRDEMAWEAHRRYTDIQVIIAGEEKFGWAERADYEPLNGDFQVCYPQNQPMEFFLTEGQFVLFFPGEPHAPGNPVKRAALCRKLVIKVLHNA